MASPSSHRGLISPSRSAASSALESLETPGSPPLDEILTSVRGRFALSPKDWRLCFQIAQGVTRHRSFLDDVLKQFVPAGAEGMALPVRVALRMAAFQHLFLDRIPAHAIVNETVEVVRAARVSKRSTGFANAVARRIVGLERERVLALEAEASRVEILRRYSIPEWIAKEMERAYGRNASRRECEALEHPASIDLRVNRLKAEPQAAQRKLEVELKEIVGKLKGEERNVPEEETADSLVLPPRFSPDGLRLGIGVDVTQLQSFTEGVVTPQDEAAQLVSYWMSARPGMRIADICAAPGGKTTHLAAMVRNQGTLWALDADPWRLARVEEACVRLGVNCVKAALNTPETRASWSGPGGEPLDAALVDPPCTNLGTLRRHPDVKWRHREGDPRVMAKKQRRILEEAAACVRPGGVLVYSVCTFTNEETTGVIDGFLARHREWARDEENTQPSFIPAEWRTPSGDWMTSTGRDGIDGFFVARLRRRSSV